MNDGRYDKANQRLQQQKMHRERAEAFERALDEAKTFDDLKAVLRRYSRLITSQ